MSQRRQSKSSSAQFVTKVTKAGTAEQSQIDETRHILACYEELWKTLPATLPKDDDDKRAWHKAEQFMKAAIVCITKKKKIVTLNPRIVY
jgi:hypothetical protein